MRSPGCVMTPSIVEDSDIVFPPLASPLPVAVIPTFSYLGGLTAQDRVIHSPNLIFIDAQLPTTVILLGLESPVSFHPGVHTLHSLWAASPQQFLSTCFSDLLWKQVSLGKMLGQRPSCAIRGTQHMPGPSLPLCVWLPLSSQGQLTPCLPSSMSPVYLLSPQKT